MKDTKYPTLEQYWGSISPKEAAEGINASARNAVRLLEDARLLFQAERYASAIALGILSIEEHGKTGHLRGLSASLTEKQYKQHWKSFRTHREKNGMWVLGDYVAKGGHKFEHFISMFDSKADHTKTLDQIKQACIYVDSFKKGFWSEPTKVADKGSAEVILEIAEGFCKLDKECTELEMQLWVKHFATESETAEHSLNALVGWYEDMQEHNLHPKGKNKAIEFFNGTLFEGLMGVKNDASKKT